MKKIDNILIGSDPELFIYNKDKAEIVSAIPFIPGTKEQPYVIGDKGYALQTDNILAEFNIPPCKTVEEFLHHMNYMKAYIQDHIAKIDPALTLLHMPDGHLKEEELQHPQAKEIGCSEDYDAWRDGEVNPKPAEFPGTLRTVGCHIHIGYSDPIAPINILIVKFCDLFLGVPSVLIEPKNERRQVYGSAGSFRHCRYGVEVRTLSGYFLKNDELLRWVFNNTLLAIKEANKYLNDDEDSIDIDVLKEDILKAMGGNVEVAKQLVETFEIPMV